MEGYVNILFDNFDLIFAFCVIWCFIGFAWLYWKRKDRENIFSDIDDSKIKYQEKYVSGRSLKNWKTSNGGARNCLRVIVTNSELLIAPIFPFSILSDKYDLEHRIDINRITNIVEGKILWRKSLTIDYIDDADLSHKIQIEPKKADRFRSALGM